MRRVVLFALLLLAAVIVLPPRLAGSLGWEPDPRARPPVGRAVTLADGRFLNVIEQGTGETPIVLVHGLPSNAGDWAPTESALAALGPYRVIAYDRVGYGNSTRVAPGEDAYTFESNARDLRELLDALEIGSAVLVGWSYGGGVVQTLAVESPERASHVVLVASVGPPADLPPEPELAERLLVSPLGEPILKWVGSVPPVARALTRQSLAAAFAGEHAIPDGYVDSTRAALHMPGTLHAWRMETLRMDTSALHPESITVPSLVIQGADDYLVPYTTGEDLHARIPDSRFTPVLTGSHMIPMTHPGEIAQAIHELVGAY